MLPVPANKGRYKNTLMKLQLKHSMQIKEYSQIVAISLEIDSPNEESVITEDEYQLMLENIKLACCCFLPLLRVIAQEL